MLTVLHVINTGGVGGGGEHLVHLTAALGPLGFDSVVAVGIPGPMSDRLRTQGVRVAVLGALGVTAPRLLRALARDTPHELLHLHGSRSGLAGAVAFRGRPFRPIVYTAHAFSFRRRAALPLRWMFARAERVTCSAAARVVCLTTADVRAAASAGINTERFVVIPNGIDASSFNGASDRRPELSIPRTAPVVGFIARFVPQKDPLRFLQVAAHVAHQIPEAHVLMVGDGPLRPDIEAAVREHGLVGRVILTGFRRDVAELLATVDVLVLTSVWEGLPITVLEAMAARRPVVVPDLPGMDEVIEDGRTGVIVRSRDVDALTAAIMRLLGAPALRAQMGEAARRRLEERFTVERMAADTAGVYEQVLQDSR